ncbi:MAG: SprT-like domain-containing protein, partial [Pseudomonadota bacterium]
MIGSDARGALDAALERALIVQLVETWAEVNQNHFRGRLRRPVFALSNTDRRLGAWDGGTRTLSISRALVLDQPWTVVREVLKHEIAHQFVDEALGVRNQTAHGPAFEAVCRQHGFDATARGLPGDGGGSAPGAGAGDGGTGAAGSGHTSPVLRRIARLLALADSPNQH